MFKAGQVFVFWRLINKNLLERFLLIICKEHTLARSTTLVSRIHPTLWANAQYWKITSANWQKQPLELFYQKAFLKNFAIFTEKQLCWSIFLIKLSAFRPATLSERDSNTGVSLLKNTCFEECFWSDFRK